MAKELFRADRQLLLEVYLHFGPSFQLIRGLQDIAKHRKA